MEKDYFIQIVKISDNHGNTWKGKYALNNVSIPTLKVGDKYELLIEAHDPKRRDIEYEIESPDIKFCMYRMSNILSFTIVDDMISKGRSVYIKVRTPQSNYENMASKKLLLQVVPA